MSEGMPNIEWKGPDPEGYLFLWIDGTYYGYVGIGADLTKSKFYLESIERDGFPTLQTAQAALLNLVNMVRL